MDNRKITIGILAGGKSSRMGEDKALLKYGQETFLEHIVNILKPLGEIVVAARAGQELSNIDGINLVYDKYTDCGPLAGMANILASSKNSWCFICAVDMPKISVELVSYLEEFCSSDYDCVCLTVAGQAQPLCALYRSSLLPIVEEQLENNSYKLQDILTKVRTKYVDIERSCFDADCVLNVNTPIAYKKLNMQEPKVFCVSGLKNVGKTTLICKLLGLFNQDGFKVAVIKHDGHDFRIDYPDTDTSRFSNAGAKRSIIFSAYQYAVLGKETTDVEALVNYCNDCDYVIIEGLKSSAYPKIEIMRREIASAPVCELQNVMALVTDGFHSKNINIPTFDINDYSKLYKYILRCLTV